MNKLSKPFKWEKIYIPILLTLLALIPFVYPTIRDLSKPSFAIIEGHTISKDKSFILIRPENYPANKNEPINVKVGNYRLPKAGLINEKKDTLEWIFDIKNHNLQIFEEGKNDISFNFLGNDYWDKHNIVINDLNVIFNVNKKKVKQIPLPKDTIPKNIQPKVITKKEPQDNYDAIPEYIEAEGMSIIDQERYSKAQAIALAEKGALIDAQANLLGIIKGTTINQKTRIEDLITTGTVTEATIKGLIKGAHKVGDTKIEEDIVKVKVRISKEDIIRMIQK